MSVELKSFPFDSMKVLNEQSGKMEGDRRYEARLYQNYFKKFLSNGVYYGHYKNLGENSMKPILDGGLNVKILKGTGIIEGADFELENDTTLIFERPATGERKDRIIIKKDSTLSVRGTSMYIKRGDGTTPATLQRDDNIYEICIAEVTVKSTANLSEADIKDTRLDRALCGIVNSLISVDGVELYQQFQVYIDSVIDNLVRKDQDVVLNGSLQAKTIKDVNNKGLSANDFTNEYKSKLDGIDVGATKNTSTATTSANGLMSKEDKMKLNGVAAGATNNTIVDNLTSTSTTAGLSARQGKMLKDALDTKQKKITIGTSVPSGGSDGDIYIQYF